MIKKEVILTLGLPVYNGVHCIEQTLISIIEACKLIDQIFIEVLIIDNSSIDKTIDIVKNYLTKIENLRIIVNHKNIGYDNNIDLIVKESYAKYIWFLGCGERIKQDALKRLINHLSSPNDYTNILLDYDVYDEKKNQITHLSTLHINSNLDLDGRNNFDYNRVGLAVSSNIVNKLDWLNVAHLSLREVGWCHVERIIQMINNNQSRTLLLQKPYFTLFYERNGWWTKPQNFGYYLSIIRIYQDMKNLGFAEDVSIKLMRLESRKNLLMRVFQFKVFGLKTNLSLLVECIRILKKDYYFWIFIFPLLLIPSVFFRISRLAYKKYKGFFI